MTVLIYLYSIFLTRPQNLFQQYLHCRHGCKSCLCYSTPSKEMLNLDLKISSDRDFITSVGQLLKGLFTCITKVYHIASVSVSRISSHCEMIKEP